MRTDRTSSTVHLLRILLWVAAILPASLLAYASFVNYQALEEATADRLERTLDVLQEHTLRVFQTVDRTIAEIDEVLRHDSDDSIRAREERFHQRLKRTQTTLPQVEAIWAFDRTGRPLAASTVFPVPPALNNADRDYFRAQADRDAGTFLGEVIQSRIGQFTFFVVSRRRTSPDGSFNGIIAVTVPPASFQAFYARVGRGTPLSAGLIRTDGTFLARYPDPGGLPRLRPGNSFSRAIEVAPETGVFVATSQIDGVERRIAYRKIPGYGVYVQAGYRTDAIRSELWSTMAGHLLYGLPATTLLLGLTFLALRRTREFLAEAERRQAAEVRLKQAQRLEAVGQLTGGVAHDFNNLLMVVSGNVERLRRDILEPRQRRALDAIDKAARRGASLTRQLLTFSRQQTLAPSVVDLHRRLPKLADMLRSSLRGDIAVSLDVPPGLWPVKVDPGELELAILNLGINARDAMPNGGALTLSARNTALSGGPGLEDLEGDFVAIAVRDTGIGIPPEVLPKVFEPFFTTKEVGKGTGLGLSQVYGFARQTGGVARITSEVGRGTEIVIYLPRSREAVAAVPEESGPAAEWRGAGTILLVEDNPEIAEVSKTNLEELGYVVVHAANAQAALDAVEGDRAIDLVFSDIVMPGPMTGLDLARHLRVLRPGMPIVLTTGYSSALHQAAPDGFTLLTKPYDLATLHRTIEEALRQRGAKILPLMLRRQE